MASDRDLWIIPLICAECGARIPADAGSVVFPCSGCGSVWMPSGGTLVRQEITVLAGHGDLHLPFWLFPFQTATPDGTAATLDGYRRLTGNINPLEPERHQVPPVVFVPAVAGMASHLMVRAGRLLTIRSPALAMTRTKPDRLSAIGFRECDAALMAATVVLATIVEERRSSMSFLRAFSVKTGNGRLCAIPFEERSGRFVHTGWDLEI